jgi:general stress protein YciG
MTVQEAGRKGGLRTAQTHGKEFYEEIGRKEGQRALIQGFLDCGEMKKW